MSTGPEQRGTIGEHLDSELATVRAEVDILRSALRTETARSDLLWELARRRGFISDEDFVASASAESLQHQ